MTTATRHYTAIAGELVAPSGNIIPTYPLAHASVRVASNVNVNLSSPPATISTITLSSGDRLLAPAQTNPLQNGIWIYQGAGVQATRPSDADELGEVAKGHTVSAIEGNNAGIHYTQVAESSGVPGTWGQNWTKDSGQGGGGGGGGGSTVTPTTFGMSVSARSGEADFATAYNNRKTQFGKVQSYRKYFDKGQALSATFLGDNTLSTTYNGGTRAFLISVRWDNSNSFDAIIAGSKDTEIQNFVKSIPANCTVYMCFYHEPDNDSDMTDYVKYRAAWDAFAMAVRAGAALNTSTTVTVKTMLICLKFILNKDALPFNNWRKYYSHDAVDVIGFDSYNPGRKNKPTPVYTLATTILGPIIQLAAYENKTWAIGEVGSPRLITPDQSQDYDPTGSGRAQWITDMCTIANNAQPVCETFLWWNRASLKDPNLDYSILPSQTPETNAYKAFTNV